MWNSSSASSSFIGINRDSEATLQSVGQYIEDYIDLVENVPNDIIRGISQFHERNHHYHHLLDKLEKTLDKAINAETEEGRKKALFWIQRYLVEIQVLSDEKLQVGQSIYEQLEIKARQLDHDIRAINIGGANIFSPVKSGVRDSGQASTARFTGTYGRTNGTVKNGGADSDDSQESSPSPDNGENGGENASTPQSGRETSRGAKKRKQRDNNDKNDNANDADVDDEDKEGESPVKDTKRTRRIKSSKYDKNNRNGGNDDDNSRDEPIRGRNASGKGGKGNSSSKGKGDHKGDHKRRQRDTSPPSVYDEPSPLDPDEPTYCLCHQISFGEMIGCDNARCPIEWFHFQCVGLTTKPKGKWYCPQCRGERSNIQRK